MIALYIKTWLFLCCFYEVDPVYVMDEEATCNGSWSSAAQHSPVGFKCYRITYVYRMTSLLMAEEMRQNIPALWISDDFPVHDDNGDDDGIDKGIVFVLHFITYILIVKAILSIFLIIAKA